MGCSSTKGDSCQGQAPPALNGKRLSVSIGEDGAGNKGLPNLVTGQSGSWACARKEANLEDKRRTGSVLCGEDIIDMLAKVVPRENRRGIVFIGSTTDDNLEDSFKDKTTHVAGRASVLNTGSIAYTCRKGLKPTAPNQDSYCILNTPEFSIFGVFDGHGGDGHFVSNYVKDALPKIVLQDPNFFVPNQRKELLKNSFIKVQQMVRKVSQQGSFSADFAGTTATLALHDVTASTLFVAQVGDSSCCLGKWASCDGEPQDVSGEKVIEDHKPGDEEEKRRIERNGGEVRHDGYANYRVFAKSKPYPGMAMSRALGDLVAHKEAGIIAEPTVREVKLTEEHQMLLLCSDGVWEFIAPQEAVAIVAKKPGLQSGIDALVAEAWDRWMEAEDGACVDDITAICMLFGEDNTCTPDDSVSNI